jgi:hypothetical protein
VGTDPAVRALIARRRSALAARGPWSGPGARPDFDRRGDHVDEPPARSGSCGQR